VLDASGADAIRSVAGSGFEPGDAVDQRILAGSRVRLEDWRYESNAFC
jgi:hypothetical protein